MEEGPLQNKKIDIDDYTPKKIISCSRLLINGCNNVAGEYCFLLSTILSNVVELESVRSHV